MSYFDCKKEEKEYSWCSI